MKFLLCLALCFAAAQAGFVGLPGALPYASPYAYAGIPSLYNTPLAYSGLAGYPYSAGVFPPTVYSTTGLGLGGLLPSAYAAPTIYSRPSVYATLLKK